MRIAKCCCCPVRTGTLVLGSLYLFASVISAINGIKDVIFGPSENDASLLMDELGLTWTQVQNYFEASSYIDKVTMVLSVGFIICSSLLLAGTRKQEPKFVFPMVVFLPLDILARLGIIITYSAIIGFLHPLTLVINVMFVAGVVAGFFTWLCFYSHYQELKDIALQEGGTEMKRV